MKKISELSTMLPTHFFIRKIFLFNEISLNPLQNSGMRKTQKDCLKR